MGGLGGLLESELRGLGEVLEGEGGAHAEPVAAQAQPGHWEGLGWALLLLLLLLGAACRCNSAPQICEDNNFWRVSMTRSAQVLPSQPGVYQAGLWQGADDFLEVFSLCCICMCWLKPAGRLNLLVGGAARRAEGVSGGVWMPPP